MLSKSLLVLLVVYFVSDFSFARRNDKSIAKGYRHVKGLPGVYKFHKEYMSWLSAKQTCEDEGATLFYPRNNDEVQAATSFFTWREDNKNLVETTQIFVGISLSKTSGEYVTIDGEPVHESIIVLSGNDMPCLVLKSYNLLLGSTCHLEPGVCCPFICEQKLSVKENNSIGLDQSDLGKEKTKDEQTTKYNQTIEYEQTTEDEKTPEYKPPTDKFFRKDYNYIEAEESFYKIHMIGLPWSEAKRVCALEGAILWHPDNDNEVDAVISFWNATQPHIERVYVGLSEMMVKRLFETTEGKLISEVYKRWLPNQPDNQTGMQHSVYTDKNINLGDYGCICNNSFICWSNQKSVSEVYKKCMPNQPDNQIDKQRCVYMNNKGYLGEYGCTSDYPFICKKTLQSLKWNSQCKMSNLDYTFYKDIGKCYKLHTTPLTWTQAYAVCRREQSHLAVVSSRLEAKHLANLTRSTPNPRVKENYQRGIYHVGFHNQFNKGWQTVRGSKLDVAEELWWDSYKPAGYGAQCGSMFYTGRLVSTDCGMISFFICEHDDTDSS